MQIGTLKDLLIELRPSLLVRVYKHRVHLMDTTVTEMLLKLLGTPNENDVAFFGSRDLVFRERVHGFDGTGRAQADLPLGPGPLAQEWLEIDVR